jgi:outer membrane protein
MKTKLLPFIVLLFLCHSMAAQVSDSTSQDRLWSLKECIDYALANNLTVKRSELAVDNSRVDVVQSQWGRYPTLNANASYGYSWGRGLDPVSNDFVSQEIRSSNLGANASVPLFNGLNIYNTVKQSNKAFAASEYDLQKSKNDVMLNVASLFITVVFNKELLENARFQLASTQQQLDRTRRQVAAGAIPKSEELNLDAQTARNELTVVQQENALALSLLQLKQALQIPASEQMDVEIPTVEPEDLVLDRDRDQIFDIAKETMPEIKSSELRIQSTFYSLKGARGNYLPRLNLVGSLNTNYSSRAESQFFPDDAFTYSTTPVAFVNQDPNYPVYGIQPTGIYRNSYGIREQLKDNIYRTLSLQLIIPIFSNYQARGSVQRSIIQHERAKIDAKEVSNTLRQNIENAYNDAVAASKTYASAQRQVASREEAFRMMTQRYGAGAANSFEYQVSQNDFFQAQTDLTRAKYDFIFRKKVLDFYQGIPLEY